jgi:hypothetical protein
MSFRRHRVALFLSFSYAFHDGSPSPRCHVTYIALYKTKASRRRHAPARRQSRFAAPAPHRRQPDRCSATGRNAKQTPSSRPARGPEEKFHHEGHEGHEVSRRKSLRAFARNTPSSCVLFVLFVSFVVKPFFGALRLAQVHRSRGRQEDRRRVSSIIPPRPGPRTKIPPRRHEGHKVYTKKILARLRAQPIAFRAFSSCSSCLRGKISLSRALPVWRKSIEAADGRTIAAG